MSTDFWAGYLSGVAGIVVGNPLDIIKVRLQAPLATSNAMAVTGITSYRRFSTLTTGVAAPILGCGALNALLFVSYKRSETVLSRLLSQYDGSLRATWLAGAVSGICTWVISAPTELIKCRAQVSSPGVRSWTIAWQIWNARGLRGLYTGGSITALRDCIGYGFYFWSYELANLYWPCPSGSSYKSVSRVLLCGGLAGIIAWVSVFPLDVVKTRVQAQAWHLNNKCPRPLQVTREILSAEGARAFFRGMTVCCIRAFMVNAVQWAVYEHIMNGLSHGQEVMFDET